MQAEMVRRKRAVPQSDMGAFIRLLAREAKRNPALWRLLYASDEQACAQLRHAFEELDVRGGVPLPYVAQLLSKLADAVYNGALTPWK